MLNHLVLKIEVNILYVIILCIQKIIPTKQRII
jgi:hypothetical protein